MKFSLVLALLLFGATASADSIRCEHTSGTNPAMTLERMAQLSGRGYLSSSAITRGAKAVRTIEVAAQSDVGTDVLNLRDVDARVELTANVSREGALENAELKLIDPYQVVFSTAKVDGRFDAPVTLSVETPRYSFEVKCYPAK